MEALSISKYYENFKIHSKINRLEGINQLLVKELMDISNFQKKKGESSYLCYINFIKSFTTSKYYRYIIGNHHTYNFDDDSSVKQLESDIKKQLIIFIKEKQQSLEKIDNQSTYILPLILLSYILFSTYIMCELTAFKKTNYWLGLFTAFPIPHRILKDYDKNQSSKRSKLLKDLEIYLGSK